VLSQISFSRLQSRIPAIRYVRIEPKWGRHRNEMINFRFDATLHLGGEPLGELEAPELDWPEQNMTDALLRQMVKESPSALRNQPSAQCSPV